MRTDRERRAAFELERCKELEKTLNHDVIAFTTCVAEHINNPASRWLHFGLTSSDVGERVLGNWASLSQKFVKVMPVDFKKALLKQKELAKAAPAAAGE